MMRYNKVIINADDFGYSHSVNRAILQSFQCSLINSTSLMANMEGFADTVGLAHTQPGLEGKIGIHLTLTEGIPLSEEIRSCPRFCDAEGRFCYRRERPLFLLTRREKKAVHRELRMQLDRVFEAGIRRIRLTRNMGRPGGYAKQFYKTLPYFYFLY
jgi:hypothetical protein